MKLPVFELEDYLGRWEFKAPYLLCTSDMEPLSMKELVAISDAESRALWDDLRLGYTEDRGLPLLREEVSRQIYSEMNAEQIVICSGAEEAIYSLFHAVLKAGDHVVVVTPCYQSLKSIPSSMGCDVSEVELLEAQGWELNLDAVKAALRPNTRMMIINFPHNPTGTTLKPEISQGLIQLARSQGIYIFSDEVYRLIELDSKNHMVPIAQAYEKGISLGVMSKGFGLAGLRIGWLASQSRELLNQARLVKHYLSICSSAPSEILAVMALRAKDQILSRNKEIVKFNLSILNRFFEANSEWIEWVRPTGGCVGFPRLKIETPIDQFAGELVEAEGVLILPASIYQVKTNHFRIGFGKKNMSEGLARFERFLKKV